MNGCSDTELIEVCTAEELALITLDLDFSDVRVYPPEKHAGIIVLRSGSMSKKKVIDLLIWIHPLLKQDNPYGKLWIVEENKIRVRSKKEEMK
jgi:predicted nuclease of predicted toxin-antitoxin system